MKIYKVEINSKFPTWNESPAILEVRAENGKKAISYARKIASREQYFDRHDGPKYYRIINT